MKLFLTWLLGVPVMVLAMVLARAMSPQGFSGERNALAAGECLRQQQSHVVSPLVADQRYRVTCNRRTVQ